MTFKKNMTIVTMLGVVWIGSLGPPLYMKVAREMDMFSTVIQFLFCGGVCTLIFQYIRKLQFTRPLKKGTLNIKTLLCIFCTAIIYAITYSFYIIAMKESSVTETTLLVKLTPLFAVVFSIIFLEEKIKSWIGVVSAVFLCCIGVIIFLNIDLTHLSHVNKWLLFGGTAIAVLFGVQITIGGYLHRNNILSKEDNTAIGMIGGAIALWFFCILKGHDVVLPATIYDLGWIILLGLTVSIPTYLKLVAYELGNSMGKLSFYDYLSPLVTAIISYYMLGEKGFEYILLFWGFVFISAGIFILHKSVIEDD